MTRPEDPRQEERIASAPVWLARTAAFITRALHRHQGEPWECTTDAMASEG